MMITDDDKFTATVGALAQLAADLCSNVAVLEATIEKQGEEIAELRARMVALQSLRRRKAAIAAWLDSDGAPAHIH
jgi:hypothetical protein